MNSLLRAGWLLLVLTPALSAAEDPPLLLQSPTLSRTQVAFAYGDDIWIASRDGGDAHRLVAGGGLK
jgi:tricorn protease